MSRAALTSAHAEIHFKQRLLEFKTSQTELKAKLSLIRLEKLNSESLSVDLDMTGPISVLFEENVQVEELVKLRPPSLLTTRGGTYNKHCCSHQ